MSSRSAEVVICGAGIAGIAAAYHLAVRRDVRGVVLVDDTLAVLHARRGGWFSAHQLGMYLLERARARGVQFLEGRVERVDTTGGRVRGVRVSARGGDVTITTPRFVNAAGPFVGRVGRLLDIDLPVFCERHAKV